MARDRSLRVDELTFSPTWYIRGGPQPASSGVVSQQSAKVPEGLEAIVIKRRYWIRGLRRLVRVLPRF